MIMSFSDAPAGFKAPTRAVSYGYLLKCNDCDFEHSYESSGRNYVLRRRLRKLLDELDFHSFSFFHNVRVFYPLPPPRKRKPAWRMITEIKTWGE
jgi:hypothetical protein